jgi:hypothetical protein
MTDSLDQSAAQDVGIMGPNGSWRQVGAEALSSSVIKNHCAAGGVGSEQSGPHKAAAQRTTVAGQPPGRIVARYRNGLSREEIELAINCAWFMKQYLPRGSKLYLATLGDDILNLPLPDRWQVLDRFREALVTEQRRAGILQHWIRWIEAEPSLHAHILFVGTPAAADRLRNAYTGHMRRPEAMRPVYDPGKLVRDYLAKEATSQAKYALDDRIGNRLEGSHKIEGAGDRVSISPALKVAAIAAGAIGPWTRTNTRRKPLSEDMRKGRSGRRPKARNQLQPTGQILMFPELRPVARLRHWYGGYMPLAVALEVRHLQHNLDLTQQQLADIIRISRPQLANALAGRFALSEWGANRLREALLTSANRIREALVA